MLSSTEISRSYDKMRASEAFTFAATFAPEMAKATDRMLKTNILPSSGLLDNPVLNTLYYNSGDAMNGFEIAFFTHCLLDGFVPKMSEKLRAGISFAVGIGAVVFAETVQTPYNILGTPDIADIPAGILGALFYLGVHSIARRHFIDRKIKELQTGSGNLGQSITLAEI